MPDEVFVLQVRDNTLVRRDIGALTDTLEWAIRNKAPDTDSRLDSILLALAAPFTISGIVALDAATLAALETINAVVSGTVAVSNFPVTQPVSGTVALDAPTLAALETITAIISGAIALDAPTLAALETINAVVSGSVSISNFPATQPVSGTIEVTNDVGNPLPVSGTVIAAIDGLPTAAFSQVAVTVGEVAIPASNLASRKTISIKALVGNGAEVYIGETGVDTTTGYELSAGDSIEMDVDATVALFARSASGTQRVSIAEVA